mgnify:CR=1 FL=1
MKTSILTTFCLFLLGSSLSVMAQSVDDPETPYHDQEVGLLKKGSKYIDAYQKAYKKKNGEMPKLNFEEAELVGLDLRGMNLENANFKNADLRGVKFGTKPSKLVPEYDDEKRLMENETPPVPASNLKGANLQGADMGEYNKEVADLSLVNLENANLSEADMTGAKFVKTNLRRANLSGASLVGCNFRKADMTLADISEADVENCTFDRTIMIQTNMAGTNVDEAVMEKVILTKKALEDSKKRADKDEDGF